MSTQCTSAFGGTCLGEVAAGTHTTRSFKPALTYTIPVGWTNFNDTTGNFGLVPPGGDWEAVDAEDATTWRRPADRADGNAVRGRRGAGPVGGRVRPLARGRPGVDVTGREAGHGRRPLRRTWSTSASARAGRRPARGRTACRPSRYARRPADEPGADRRRESAAVRDAPLLLDYRRATLGIEIDEMRAAPSSTRTARSSRPSSSRPARARATTRSASGSRAARARPGACRGARATRAGGRRERAPA